jgi:hypothetical protein
MSISAARRGAASLSPCARFFPERRDRRAHLHDGDRRFGNTRRRSIDLVLTATRVSPYGLVRPHLGTSVPQLVDEAVATTADAILRLGDT